MRAYTPIGKLRIAALYRQDFAAAADPARRAELKADFLHFINRARDMNSIRNQAKEG